MLVRQRGRHQSCSSRSDSLRTPRVFLCFLVLFLLDTRNNLTYKASCLVCTTSHRPSRRKTSCYLCHFRCRHTSMTSCLNSVYQARARLAMNRPDHWSLNHSIPTSTVPLSGNYKIQLHGNVLLLNSVLLF